MGISKNIHLVFLRKDETIPPLFKECERKIRDMHPADITILSITLFSIYRMVYVNIGF